MEKQYISNDFKHFLHGGDYNPEQWIDTKEIWDEDMRLFSRATEEYILNQLGHSFKSLEFYKSVLR